MTSPTLERVTIRPSSLSYELLLTATSAISHHDPAVQDDSNRTLFNRQKQLQQCDADTVTLDQLSFDALCARHPVPVEAEPLLSQLDGPAFAAVCLVRLFLDLYNSADGQGLFSGLERYNRLEARLRLAAIAAPSLRSLWDRLCSSLQVGIHPSERDHELLILLALPAKLQQLILRSLTDDYRTTLALARFWHQTAKAGSAAYAAVSGQAASGAKIIMCFPATTTMDERAEVIEVPAVSASSLRHQVVREPAWLHLCAALGLTEALPGQGPVPPGVEAIFYNGGNIRAGAKQPSNTFGLANKVRQLYPTLDLLGGVTDSFDLGESRLGVAAWLVCRENREALVGSDAYDLPSATVSVFDLLDDVTLTRQAGMVGEGQMIYSFEALCPGAQILVRLRLRPFTPILTQGALIAAVETYLSEDQTVGGQASRGFGQVRGEWLRGPDDAPGLRRCYEEYLAVNYDDLRAGLVSGKLGTPIPILS